jgi:hypothetical protein
MEGAQRAASKLAAYSRGVPVSSFMPKTGIRQGSTPAAAAASKAAAKPKVSPTLGFVMRAIRPVALSRSQSLSAVLSWLPCGHHHVPPCAM